MQALGKLRRAHGDDRGFTLVELLVVVTILGILAAVVVASLIGLTGTANTNACLEEERTVQSAVAAYMAANNLSTIPAHTPADKLTGSILDGPFLRAPTRGNYSWDAAGTVTAGTCP